MNWKAMIATKTFWAGLALVVTGIGTWIADRDAGKGLQTILTGLGLIFLRQGIESVK
jgi:hypothetical protein